MTMDAIKSTVTLIAAIVLLLLGGLLIAYLLVNVGASEPIWQRYVYLLSGVEAVVFAAVGWLFGKEVHREQAAKAEKDRDAAENEKAKAIAAAADSEATGRQLARAILATAAGDAELEGIDRQAGVGANANSPMAALARQARNAYPGT